MDVALLSRYHPDSDINYLLTMSLDKIVFLPFGKLMDDYRWSLFAGDIDNSNLNSEWWNMRYHEQPVLSSCHNVIGD